MAKPAKKTSPLVWVGLLVTCVAVYMAVGGDEAPAPTTEKRQRPKPTSSKKDDYQPQDYVAKFDRLNLKSSDAFVPLVVRKDGKSSVPTIDGGIPSAFADGDGNWQYKGFATIDGTSSGLLENQNTGEGVFVKPGERWKSSRVLTITKDSIVMQGVTGAARTIPIVSEDSTSGTSMASTALTPLPVPSPLTGNIGDPANVGRGGRGRRGGGGAGGGASFGAFSSPAAGSAASAPAATQPIGIVIGQ